MSLLFTRQLTNHIKEIGAFLAILPPYSTTATRISILKYSANCSKMPAVNGSLILKYTKVVPEAFAPSKGSVKAAGYDIKSAFDITVPARGKALVDTGLKIQLPEGCYGRIAPRSGLAVKNFIDVGGKTLVNLFFRSNYTFGVIYITIYIFYML